MKSRKILGIWILGISAMAISLFISLQGNWDKKHIAFRSPNFWIAVSLSTILLLAFAGGIYKTGKILNEHAKWQEHIGRRLLLQSIFGLLFPLGVHFIIIWIYFKVLGTDIIENKFLSINYPVIFSFFIIANLFSVAVELFQQSRLNQEDEPGNKITEHAVTVSTSEYPTEGRTEQEQFILKINYKRVDLTFNVAEDILYFYRSGRRVFVVTTKGREYPVEWAIGALQEEYERAGFLQINRALIVNSKIIKTYASPSDVKRDTLIIVFKGQYLSAIEDPESTLFEITGRYLDDFKRKFEEI